MQLIFSVPADGIPFVSRYSVSLVFDAVWISSFVPTTVASLPNASLCDRERRYITDNKHLSLLLGPSDMISSPGEAESAVSLLKAIFIHKALARNPLIFQTPSIKCDNLQRVSLPTDMT